MTQDTYMLNISYFMKPCLQVIFVKSWLQDKYKLIHENHGLLSQLYYVHVLGVARITEKAQIAWNYVATVGQGSLRPVRTIP